jgi:hypothetical protein
MFLLGKDKVLCDVCITLLMCSSQLRVLWMFKARYLAELMLFITCTVYLDCSGVLLIVICRTLHLFGWSCIRLSVMCLDLVVGCAPSFTDLILQYRLIIYGFMSRSRIFHYIWRRHHCRWRATKHMLGPLSREGSLLYHTCCDTWPRFFRFHPKDRPIQSPLTTHMRMWSIYSNPDPHVSHSVASYDTQGSEEALF